VLVTLVRGDIPFSLMVAVNLIVMILVATLAQAATLVIFVMRVILGAMARANLSVMIQTATLALPNLTVLLVKMATMLKQVAASRAARTSRAV
jgi:hypothetical protein